MKYKPGDSNIADYMSRHPKHYSDGDIAAAWECEEYINNIFVNAVSESMKIDDIKKHSESDEIISNSSRRLNLAAHQTMNS